MPTEENDPVFPKSGSGVPRYFEDVKPGDMEPDKLIHDHHSMGLVQEWDEWKQKLEEAASRQMPIQAVPQEDLPRVEIEFPARELPQWEYRIIQIGTANDAFLDTLNAMGKNGWQVCERIGEFNLLMIREILPESDEELKERLKRERFANETDEEREERWTRTTGEMLRGRPRR